MPDLSPMERAVRALEPTYVGPPERRVDGFIRRLADLRTSDPDAFAAVLAECGGAGHEVRVLTTPTGPPLDVEAQGISFRRVSEGQAVIEGRVVELEPKGRWHSDPGRCNHYETDSLPTCRYRWSGEWTQLYRVKPERSTDRTTRPCDCEDSWCPHAHANDERGTGDDMRREVERLSTEGEGE